MASVGIRNLKNHLSHYVRRVEAGEPVAVTDRGRVVARLVPPESDRSTHGGSRYAELVAAGLIRPALEGGDPLANLPALRWPPRCWKRMSRHDGRFAHRAAVSPRRSRWPCNSDPSRRGRVRHPRAGGSSLAHACRLPARPRGTDTMAVEVVSPSSARADRFKKRRLYQRRGVETCWVVDPDAQLIEVWHPRDERPEIISDVVRWRVKPDAPELRIELPPLFARLPG